MKKMMLLAAVLSTSFALAGRADGTENTNLVFNMEVVAGCAVNLAGSYSSTPENATYNGTDTAVTTLNIDASEGEPNFRCQTGTDMSLTSTATFSTGTTGGVQTETDSASVVFGGNPFSPTGNILTTSGRLSLVRTGGTITNDDKTLEGDYTVTLAEDPFANGQNGDTWNLSATFQADEGQFEPAIGEYSGTVRVSVEYN